MRQAFPLEPMLNKMLEDVRHNKSTILKLIWTTLEDMKTTGWRHDMETFSTLLALCEENPLFTGSRDAGDLRLNDVHVISL